MSVDVSDKQKSTEGSICMCKCPEAGVCLPPSSVRTEWEQSDEGVGGTGEVTERDRSQSMILMAVQGQWISIPA